VTQESLAALGLSAWLQLYATSGSRFRCYSSNHRQSLILVLGRHFLSPYPEKYKHVIAFSAVFGEDEEGEFEYYSDILPYWFVYEMAPLMINYPWHMDSVAFEVLLRHGRLQFLG
jgi:hypothetical protein